MTERDGVDNPRGNFEIFALISDGNRLEQNSLRRSKRLRPDYSAGGELTTSTRGRDGDCRGADDAFKRNADGSEQEKPPETENVSE
jgi:hypothetical protein